MQKEQRCRSCAKIKEEARHKIQAARDKAEHANNKREKLLDKCEALAERVGMLERENHHLAFHLKSLGRKDVVQAVIDKIRVPTIALQDPKPALSHVKEG